MNSFSAGAVLLHATSQVREIPGLLSDTSTRSYNLLNPKPVGVTYAHSEFQYKVSVPSRHCTYNVHCDLALEDPTHLITQLAAPEDGEVFADTVLNRVRKYPLPPSTLSLVRDGTFPCVFLFSRNSSIYLTGMFNGEADLLVWSNSPHFSSLVRGWWAIQLGVFSNLATVLPLTRVCSRWGRWRREGLHSSQRFLALASSFKVYDV